MVLEAYPKIFERQQKIVTPAVFKKGIINAVYVQSRTADVEITGTSQTVIKAVPLSSAIDPATVSPGKRCRIDMFDETNPRDSVVAYVY